MMNPEGRKFEFEEEEVLMPETQEVHNKAEAQKEKFRRNEEPYVVVGENQFHIWAWKSQRGKAVD